MGKTADWKQTTDLAEIVSEWIDPTTTQMDVEGAASGLAWEALWRVKILLDDSGIEGDVGDLLRLIGQNSLDIAFDWAKQADEGVVDYS